MIRARALLLVVLSLAACSGAPSLSEVAFERVPHAPIDLDPPEDGYQVTFGPFSVPSGNVQLCRTLKLDNEEPIALNRFDLKMLRGSHHFILFRAQQKLDSKRKPTGTYYEYPDQVFECQPTLNFEEWEFVFDVNEAGGTDYRLAEGQAVVLPPHAQLMVQAHFVNSSQVKSTNGGYDVVNMYKTDIAKVKHPVRGKFTVNTRVRIPPLSHEWSTSRRCSFSRTVNIVSMTGHFHEQGRKFEVQQQITQRENTNVGTLYCSGDTCDDAEGREHNWDHPLFKYFAKPQLVNGTLDGAAEGVFFTCTYDNGTDREITFGGLADTQEHCNLFFQYYDNDENNADPLSCAEGEGGW